MENIFTRLFRKRRPPESETARAEVLGGGQSVFSAWSGDAYSNDVYRAAVDSIARNAAKLKGSHVIKFQDQSRAYGDNRLDRLLQIEPNPFMTAYDLIYKLVTRLFLYNDTFAFLQRDERGRVVGIYPLAPVRVEFLADAGGALLCHFMFTSGKEAWLLYSDVVHLRRNFNDNDLLGDPNSALSPALQLAHTQNEGLVSAIKNGAHLRGILKAKTFSNLDALKEMQKQFVEDFLSVANDGGIAIVDEKSDYIPLNNSPYTIDGPQLEAVRKKIYDYLGTNEAIVSSSYTEDQWAAFYESTVEPIALQLGLEFTRKIFNGRERAFGNSIIFESGRLQFSSNQTKVSLIKELVPLGLLSVNQALEILNLPSVPDGDKRIISLNYVNADKADQYQLSGKLPREAATSDRP